jgi:hypothetical protein
VKFYWKPGEPPGKPSGGGPSTGPTDAIFWAHRVEAALACIGFGKVRRGEKEGQLQLSDVTAIHPGFINSSIKPESPGFGLLPGSPFYVNPNTELELVQSPAGGYVILQPIQFVDGKGLLTDPIRAKMLFADSTARKKMVDQYAGQRKSLTVMRTAAGFASSKLYRVRSAQWYTVFSSYFYPVLLELGA